VNPVGELDQEVLLDYLDDALSPAHVQNVTLRLADEPELAGAMHELRAGRVLRAAAWRSMEPRPAEVTCVIDSVASAVRGDYRRRNARMIGRWLAGAAAVILIFVGAWSIRGSRGSAKPGAMASGPAPTPVEQSAPATTIQPGPFHVALVDPTGRIVPVVKFSRMDEARQFAHDLMTYQIRREEAAQGRAVLVSDHF
jgi:hypothetical protein